MSRRGVPAVWLRVPGTGLALVLATAGCPTRPDDAGKPAPTASVSASAGRADAAPPPSLATPNDAGVLNATGVPASEVVKFVNPKGLPAYDGPTGAVEGTITVKGPPAPDSGRGPSDFRRCPDAVAIYGKRFREGAARPDGTRPLADTVVAVTGYAGYFVPEKRETTQVAIVGCGFDKRTVTMTFGQALEVRNTSTEFWSPELDPAPNPVIMMLSPRAPDPVRLYPKRPGLLTLRDHDRKYATADLFVLFHPLHAVSDTTGHYRIDGLPIGKLKVNARHPAIDAETSVDLDVRANVVAKVDLVLEHVLKDAGPPDDDAGYRPKVR